jgi:hypothetical protein
MGISTTWTPDTGNDDADNDSDADDSHADEVVGGICLEICHFQNVDIRFVVFSEQTCREICFIIMLVHYEVLMGQGVFSVSEKLFDGA